MKMLKLHGYEKNTNDKVITKFYNTAFVSINTDNFDTRAFFLLQYQLTGGGEASLQYNPYYDHFGENRGQWRFFYFKGESGDYDYYADFLFQNIDFMPLQDDSNSRTDFFFTISIDGGYSDTDAKISLFIYVTNPDNGNYGLMAKEEIILNEDNSTSWTSSPPSRELFGNGIKRIDYGDALGHGDPNLKYPRVGTFNFVKNTYLSASDNVDVQMVWNMANTQLPFKNQIGMYLDPNSGDIKFNSNIQMNKTQSLEKNLLKICLNGVMLMVVAFQT